MANQLVAQAEEGKEQEGGSSIPLSPLASGRRAPGSNMSKVGEQCTALTWDEGSSGSPQTGSDITCLAGDLTGASCQPLI